jgi:hypothetical protein
MIFSEELIPLTLAFKKIFLIVDKLAVCFVVLNMNHWRCKQWNVVIIWCCWTFGIRWRNVNGFLFFCGPKNVSWMPSYFLTKVASFCNFVDLPYIVGGDFLHPDACFGKIDLLYFILLLIYSIMLFILWPWERFTWKGDLYLVE